MLLPFPLTTVVGSEGVSAYAVPGGDFGMLLLRMFLYLGITIVVLYAALRWGLPRLTGRGPGSSGRLRIQERLSLGGGRLLCVVQVEEEYFLVGVSDRSIQLITRLRSPESPETSPGINRKPYDSQGGRSS